MSKYHRQFSQPRLVKAGEAWSKGEDQRDKGNLRSAFRLFLSAAKAGYSAAQVSVGYFYDVGVGIKPNPRKAMMWYQRAYRGGGDCADCAANNIGTIWRDKGDSGCAITWLKRAVKLGSIDSNVEIAKIYLAKCEPKKATPYLNRVLKSDRVTEEDLQEARGLLKKAAKDLKRRSS